MKSDTDLALEFVKYRIHHRHYSQWRSILAELGCSDTDFLLFLKKHHHLEIDKKADPVLYLVEDSQQRRLMEEEGIIAPTLLQIAMTSKAFALSEEDAAERWKEAMQVDAIDN